MFHYSTIETANFICELYMSSAEKKQKDINSSTGI